MYRWQAENVVPKKHANVLTTNVIKKNIDHTLVKN